MSVNGIGNSAKNGGPLPWVASTSSPNADKIDPNTLDPNTLDLMERENAGRPPIFLPTRTNPGQGSVPRRVQGALKKLERDVNFGAALLEGIEAADQTPSLIIDTIGDVFNAGKRAKLKAAVERTLGTLDSIPRQQLLEALQTQLGRQVASALNYPREEPEQTAGYIVGLLAADKQLGKRTSIAQVANRLNAITDKVLSEQSTGLRPNSPKKSKARERPRPKKVGTEGQGALFGKAIRDDGRISGRRFVGAYRETELKRAAALGLKVDTNADAILDKCASAAGFDHSSGTIRIRSNATALEWFHEMTHAEQWLELGPKAYLEQSRFERELHVFQAVKADNARFNTYEFEAARNYIVRLAEQEGLPLPDGVLH